MTSANARFIPFAPVGGTMCALSPARKSRPYCIGSTTKLRIGVMPFLQHFAFGEFAGSAEPLVQFIPDTVVGPGFNLLIVIALQIEPRQARGAHGVKRKAAIGVGIDQFVIRWRALRQNAQPTKGVVPLEYTEHAIRNAWPADTVKSVASRYEIAVDFLGSPVVPEADFRFLRFQVVNGDVVHFKEQRRAVRNSTL